MMKKIILFILALIPFIGSTQTITQSNHFPITSTQFTTVQCDSTGITGGTNIGNGITWDYSSIALRTETAYEKTNYVSAVSSNTNYPQATTSVGTATNNVSYYSTDGSYEYYWGGNVSVKLPTGTYTDLNFKFTSPSVQMAYPSNYNTTTSFTTAGSSSLGNFTGSSKTYVEGVGTLILTAKTFTDIVRVKTVETFTIPVIIIGNTILNRTKFDYYSISASRHPILTIDSTFLTSAAGSDKQKFVSLQKNYQLVSVTENQKQNIDVTVFPNPTSNYINFSTQSTEATKLLIFDIKGQLIASEFFEDGKTKKNISNFPNGIYSYAILNKENIFIKNGTFNVTK
jgi:hypothetical protein